MALDYFLLLSGGLYTDDDTLTSEQEVEFFVSRGWLSGFPQVARGSIVPLLKYIRRLKEGG